MAALQQFQQVSVSQVSPERCHAEGTGLQTAVAGKTASLTVHMVNQEGKEHHDPVEVSCELVSSDGRTKTKAKVQKMIKGKYHISYQPENGGQHQLHIRVADIHIRGSPFLVLAISPKPSLVIPKPTTIDKLRGPTDVAVNGSGDIIVCECYNNISIFNKDGSKKRSFGSDLLSGPYGVTVTDTGDILVCDWGHNCIRHFSSEGEELKPHVGTRGSGQLQFYRPNFITIHPRSKRIYITEYHNNRVQVLNPNLTYYKTFGEGDLSYPEGIAIDYSADGSRDRVYVVDYGHRCVKIYAPNGGKPIGELRKNDSQHVMRRPKGVAVDSTGRVYVTEAGNDCVSMFDKDGAYIDWFGSRGKRDIDFNYPIGITIRGGKIYIADYGNSRVKVFSPP